MIRPFKGAARLAAHPKQGTLIGQSGQARRLPDRQQANGSPAPTTMRAGYSEGSNTRLRHFTPTSKLKQKALDRTAPPNTRTGRYTPPDKLLAFLESL